MPGLLAYVAPMNNDMLLIISSQFHEALRHTLQASSVNFDLGDFLPAPVRVALW